VWVPKNVSALEVLSKYVRATPAITNRKNFETWNQRWGNGGWARKRKIYNYEYIVGRHNTIGSECTRQILSIWFFYKLMKWIEFNELVGSESRKWILHFSESYDPQLRKLKVHNFS
jgi:hypothetical protein